jgi:hypothetical protein
MICRKPDEIRLALASTALVTTVTLNGTLETAVLVSQPHQVKHVSNPEARCVPPVP